jgi:hypothetical protein
MGAIGVEQQNGTQAQECNGEDKSGHLIDSQLHQSLSSKSSREKIIFTVIVCQSGVTIHFSALSNRREQHQVAGDDLETLRCRREKRHAQRSQHAVVLAIAGDGFKRETAHEIVVLRAQAVNKCQATAAPVAPEPMISTSTMSSAIAVSELFQPLGLTSSGGPTMPSRQKARSHPLETGPCTAY